MSIDHRADIERELEAGTSRSVITLVNAIIGDAYIRGASDIHIDKARSHIQVRLRIDGLLQNSYSLPADCHAELISRIKILAGLRTDEHFVPHDGRFALSISDGEEITVRLSMVPTHHGENAVLRLLSHTTRSHTMRELGMTEANELAVRNALSAPDGLVLLAGPTGSGKTTTLYALMQELQQSERSLISIEDPVEYELKGVTQIPVHVRHGVTFADGLRSILRQDPDVIMVGEIRDAETASLTIQASRTGHLVLSTLHTRNTRSAISRLENLGVNEHDITSTIRLVIAQRLVRKICADCLVEYIPLDNELEQFSQRFPDLEGPGTYFIGKGCFSCDGRGYSGRIGVFELSTLQSNASRVLRSLLDDALEKVRFGLTTVEEVIRVFHGS